MDTTEEQDHSTPEEEEERQREESQASRRKQERLRKETEEKLHNAARLQAARSLRIEKHNTDCEEFPRDEAEAFYESSDTDDDEAAPNDDRQDRDRSRRDIATQVDFDDHFSKNYPLCIRDEDTLFVMCNLKSFDMLKQLVRLVDDKYPPYRRCLISTRDCIIITLARLRLDISFAALAVFYHRLNGATLAKVFFDTVHKLASILGSIVVPLPEAEKVPKWYEPKSETSEYESWTVMLEKPGCEKCYFERYYHHTSDYSLKLALALNPRGITLSLEGKYYQPPTSDDDELDDDEYDKKFRKTDTVMRDRCYRIDDKSLAQAAKMFKLDKSKGEMTLEEQVASKKQKCGREHLVAIKTCFGQFKAFEDTFPWNFVDAIHEIFVVCCAIAVMQTPMIHVNEF